MKLRIAALTCGLLLPGLSWAQQSPSGIAGVVKDTSGAVLPGVIVEAASPALIEKVRTVVTDGEGQYKIVDVRPGTYVVTFSLAGFTTLRREGIELPAGFTATVNAEMRVGAVSETVTVTGASPLVDTQNVRQSRVVENELLDALPIGAKSVGALVTLTPGFSGQPDVGGTAGAYANSRVFGYFHGKTGNKVLFDGMRTNNVAATGSVGTVPNAAAVEEMTVETGGASAESPAAGIVMNMIPKEGGNTFKFGIAGVYTNDRLQSDNLTDELRARGLTTVNKVLDIYDVGATVGGPIRKDRLWFFTSQRAWGNAGQMAAIFFNQTQGTPLYTPDRNRPAERDETYRSHTGRLTWQASKKNKVTFFADIQDVCLCRSVYGGNAAPEAVLRFDFSPNYLVQSTWSLPFTGRLLLEAGASAMVSHYKNARDPAVTPNDISILELSTNFRYNASSTYGLHRISNRYAQRFSVSYITGSHAFKVGIQQEEGVQDTGPQDVNGDVNYVFLTGAPVSLVQWAQPFSAKEILKADLGAFVQDQWTIKRLTLNLGLRFDYFNAYVPEQHVPAGPWVPARDFAPVHDVPLWSDLNPRLGAAYDLFGNGRTALKMSLGRYVGVTALDLTSPNNPMRTSVNVVNRTWSDANGNYMPDCELGNPSAHGECGVISNANFGKLNIVTRYADDVINGFGVRDYDWDLAAEVQHQLGPGISVSGGYYRNWSNHFYNVDTGSWNAGVVDNLEVTPADYSPYCITAPVDPRLPGGGGYPVCGLYDLSAAKFGRVNNLVTRASHYGKQKRANDFFDIGVNTQRRSGMRLGGGVSTGRTVTDNCFVVDSPQQLLYCRVTAPWSANLQVKLYGSYPLPGAFMLSGTLQNVAGPMITADYPAPNAAIAPSLGRNLAACGTRDPCTATATVPLIEPGTQFEDRRSQLDLRLSRIFRLRQTMQLQANFDIYNVLNNSGILGINTTYGPAWRRPLGAGGAVAAASGTAILDGRLIEFSGQLTF